MKCEKCGKELTEDSKICENCAQSVQESSNEPKNEGVEEVKTETIATNLNNYSDVKPSKKKGSTGVIIGFIIVLVLLIGAGIWYMFVYNSPKGIFNKAINTSLKAIEKSLDSEEFTTYESNVSLGIETIDLKDSSVDEIKEMVEGAELNVNVEYDKNEKKENVRLELKTKLEELIDLECYFDVEEEKAYLYVEELIDKYLEVEIEEESLEQIKEQLENTTSLSLGQKINVKKVLSIVEEEIKGQIKDKEITAKKVDIEIDGKTIKANKNTLSMGTEEFVKSIKTIVENLNQNEEFINCFEEKDEVKQALEDFIDEIEEIDLEDDETKIELSIYTIGIIPQIVRFDITAINEDDETIELQIAKKDNETIQINAVMNLEDEEEQKITFEIKTEENTENFSKIKITIQSEEIGKIVISMEVEVTYNKEIKTVDESKIVKIEELTEEDMTTITNNLQKMPIYNLLESYMGDSSTSTNINAIDTIEDITDIDIEDEDTDVEEVEETSLEKNEIKSYDDKLKISFDIPSGYEASSYNTDTLKTFKKEMDDEDINVQLNTRYSTVDEYMKSKETVAERYKEDYSDVQLTEIEEHTVEDNTFKYRTLKYKWDSSVGDEYDRYYITTYITIQLSEEYILVVEVDGEISEVDLNEFLNIKINK